MQAELRVNTHKIGPTAVHFVEPLPIERGAIIDELQQGADHHPRETGLLANLFVVAKTNTLGMLWAQRQAEDPATAGGVIWVV